MNHDPNTYNVTVRRVTVDGESTFEARVMELPDVSGYGESAADAYSVAVQAIADLQEIAAKENDGDFPAPFEPETEYSGRVTLRMPKSVHRSVALRALQESVSINSYIVSALMTNMIVPVTAAPFVRESLNAALIGPMAIGSLGQSISVVTQFRAAVAAYLQESAATTSAQVGGVFIAPLDLRDRGQYGANVECGQAHNRERLRA